MAHTECKSVELHGRAGCKIEPLMTLGNAWVFSHHKPSKTVRDLTFTSRSKAWDQTTSYEMCYKHNSVLGSNQFHGEREIHQTEGEGPQAWWK